MNCSGRIISALFFFMFVGLLFPAATWAQQAQMTTSGPDPWVILADQFVGEQKEEIYLAIGHVKMTRGNEVIWADRVRFHAESRTAEAQGDVIFTSESFKVACRRLIFNLDYNIGKFYDGTVFFPENHYYISGDEIEKTGPETLFLLKGRTTTCDGPRPAWTLEGVNITVQREGYATAKHVTFSTRYFPLLYFPWLKIPVKENRQSGFLMPDLRDSSRDGLTFTVPYYWAISDSKDMTVYLTRMAHRGLETCLEFRYNDWGGKGNYRLTYLRDQDPPTIDYPEPEGPTVKEDRYWFRGMSDLTTESGFLIRLDLDWVSDPKYLDEFDPSFTGYTRTSLQFLEEFGREPAEPLDPMRRNTLLATKAINNMSLNASLEYTDNLNDPDNLTTIQRLPKIDLGFARTALPGTPFFFENYSNYTYFARKTDEAGHRLDLHPRLYWPTKVYGWLDLEPSLGFRETVYYPHGLDDPEKDHHFLSRELYDAQMTASTNLSRIFDLGWGKIAKVRHRIKPEIAVYYTSELNQNDLPYLDGYDRISEQQEIRYGLVNYLTAKVRKQEAIGGTGVETGEDAVSQDAKPWGQEYEYYDFFRLGLWRSYDFVEAKRDLSPHYPGYPEDFHRPHRPWYVEMEMDFSPYFWARTISEFDTYTETFTDHSLEFMARDRRGDFLSVLYDLNTEPYLATGRENYEYEEIRYLINLAINQEMSFQYERRYSLMMEEDRESYYSLNFQRQCWGLRLEYMDRPDNRQISVFFSLFGIGEVGSFSYAPGRSSLSDRADSQTVESLR